MLHQAIMLPLEILHCTSYTAVFSILMLSSCSSRCLPSWALRGYPLGHVQWRLLDQTLVARSPYLRQFYSSFMAWCTMWVER